jgi:L,D-peptidoglycan transpeptidase YkuD (ErfK/YbiS/YcfS/YnhG family)
MTSSTRRAAQQCNCPGTTRVVRGLAAASVLLAVAAVVLAVPTQLPWKNSLQLVLVITGDWDANQGTLQTFDRENGGWTARGEAVSVSIGRTGSAWGVGLHDAQPGPSKKEGDGRSPAGVFRIGQAFGYAPDVATALDYAAMSGDHWCVDVEASPLYNRIVDSRVVGKEAVAGSSEPMRRDLHANGDQRYKLGFVIDHNESGARGKGSCIFAHLWRSPGEPTAGCTAMEEGAMRRLYTWLQPARQPIFVLLPKSEYLRLREPWQLPAMAP